MLDPPELSTASHSREQLLEYNKYTIKFHGKRRLKGKTHLQ